MSLLLPYPVFLTNSWHLPKGCSIFAPAFILFHKDVNPLPSISLPALSPSIFPPVNHGSARLWKECNYIWFKASPTSQPPLQPTKSLMV